MSMSHPPPRPTITTRTGRAGGHWCFVEHGPDGVHGFEGRYREVTPQERIVMPRVCSHFRSRVSVQP